MIHVSTIKFRQLRLVEKLLQIVFGGIYLVTMVTNNHINEMILINCTLCGIIERNIIASF